MISYRGKPLKDYSLWELGDILRSLQESEARREEASKHPKFDKINSKGMDFPPPNPEFLKLKSAVELEIKERQNRSEQ